MALQYPKLPSVPTRRALQAAAVACRLLRPARAARPLRPKGLPAPVQELLNAVPDEPCWWARRRRSTTADRAADEWGHDACGGSTAWCGQPQPAGRADDAQPARPVRDEQLRRGQHAPHAPPEPAASQLRAGQLLDAAAARSPTTRRCCCGSTERTPASGEPNENYAREVMELFCLGADPGLEDGHVRPLAGTANIVQPGRHPRGGPRADRLAVRLEQERRTAHRPSARTRRTTRPSRARHRPEDDLRPDRRLQLAGRLQAGGAPPEPCAVPLLHAVELLPRHAAAAGTPCR